MGLCYSHLHRRRPEHEPLLPTIAGRDRPPPPQSRLDKAVDISAAVTAGKLPSNDQLARTLQFFLRFLRTDPVPGHEGHLSQRGQKLVEDIKEIAEATLQVSAELNYDDKLQDLLFQTANIQEGPLRIDLEAVPSPRATPASPMGAYSSPPTTEELNMDVKTLVKSSKTLLRLIATSAAFRMILTDLLQVIRETLDEFASDIDLIALQAQIGAEKVRDDATLETLKGKVKEAAEDVGNIGKMAANRWATVDPAQKTKDIIIGRVQEAIHRANNNPKYRSALHSILLIFRKYIERAKLASNIMVQSTGPDVIALQPVISMDEKADAALSDLKTLMERAAFGFSLDPLILSLSTMTTNILAAPTEYGKNIREYFSDLAVWLDQALLRSEYATSLTGIRAAEYLYDRGRILFTTSDSQWAQDIRRMINYMDEFIDALQGNRAILRFVRSIDAFSSDIVQFGRDAVKSGSSSMRIWREELWKDAIGWLLPKLFKSLHAVPMPRVEFKNNMVDVAIDSLWVTAPPGGNALVPDNLWIQSWSKITLDMTDGLQIDGKITKPGPVNQGTVRSATRMRIHVHGIRISAHNVGYYFKYKGFIGYHDEGLFGIDVGGISRVGQGLCMDVDMEMASKSHRISSSHPFFRVLKVKVDLSGLRLSIDKSKHWILNKVVLQPLSGLVIKRLVAGELERRIQQGLEAAGRMVSDVSDAADRRSEDRDEGATLEDYWGAFLEKASSPFSSPTSRDTEENVPLATTHTTATLKGVVRTTVVQPSPEMSHLPTPSETVMAIGGGAQIFPGKGGPYGENGPDSIGTVVQGAVKEVRGKTVETTEVLTASAVKAREDLERAEERKETRKRVERKRSGWRSRVFDLEG